MTEGAGMPGAQCARSRAWCVVNTRVSHHGHTGNTRHSPRNGFNGLLRALPGDRALLPPSPAALAASLTPASGRQDHTTSPSASARFVKRAFASTASRPTFVTIAKRPSEGRDWLVLSLRLAKREAKYFCRWGLDSPNQLEATAEFNFLARRLRRLLGRPARPRRRAFA